MGGGLLRTGCGPGPLEPDLGNASVGNTAREEGLGPHPRERLRPFRLMRITVNGEPREVAEGISLEALLAHLGVTLKYTALRASW